MCSKLFVFSLYGWLLARVQTGNYCIWIDSDVHVRSRCIAPAMFSHRFKLFFFLKVPPQILPNANAAGLWFMCSSHAIVFFFAMHNVCLTLQLVPSVPSTWFKPPCALESCFFPALNVVQHATFAVAGTYIYIEILYCICFQTIYLFYTYNCKLVPIRISQFLWREPCRPWKKIWSCFWPGMAFTKM